MYWDARDHNEGVLDNGDDDFIIKRELDNGDGESICLEISFKDH